MLDSDDAQLVSFARHRDGSWRLLCKRGDGAELLDERARCLADLDRADVYALDPLAERLLLGCADSVVLRELPTSEGLRIDLAPLAAALGTRDLDDRLAEQREVGWAALSAVGYPGAVARCTPDELRSALRDALLAPIELAPAAAARLRERFLAFPELPPRFQVERIPARRVGARVD